MDRAAIEARKAALEEERRKAEMMLLRLQGAIADCDYWLKQIEAGEQPASSEDE